MASSQAARWALVVSVVSLGLSVATSLLMLLYVIQHDRELAARDQDCATKIERMNNRLDAVDRRSSGLAEQVGDFDDWVRVTREQLSSKGWKP